MEWCRATYGNISHMTTSAALKHLDLFSGIGGFALGLRWAGGFETVGFCEIDPWCQKLLAQKFPNIPIYNDVRNITNDQLEADNICGISVITGGFPCQDISIAGDQSGIEAPRSGLWSELCRIIGEVRPKYAIIENVSNLLNGPIERRGQWFSRVLRDLAEIGYNAEWYDIPASYVGAWHRRGRAWILAYPNQISRFKRRTQKPILRQLHLSQQLTRSFEKWPGRSNLPTPTLCGVIDGIPRRVDRLKGLGNAVVPQIPEILGRAIINSMEQPA